ncbi:MAG: N-6 DNA methylase [Acidobacteriia bacterium]|nr:N-6 DNA methylase [Terriglobia bacterium]
MRTLSTELRRRLERTVVEARDVAETGARVALKMLAVHHHEPYGHMGAEQRALRRRLRVHARQLGDRFDARSGSQAIDRLVHECAYEYWHGMLFARFLAENDLFIEPEMGIAVSLDECEELAGEQGVDKWALASRFAHRLLPQVFRPDHPVFEVQFAREHRLKLESLVEDLPADLFRASDSLGWVYQFWQSRKKDEVNRSEVKIGADELPAVTQRFTEPYMVQFLLHNSLGAWWVGRHTDKRCPVDLTYLRKTQEGAPAAGGFEGWPDDLSELRLLDPCCGSGHFLVAAFLMLVPMRMALENLPAAEAIDAVLRDNLHGLELDPRCVALAAFSLALAAWTWPGAGGYRTLPKLNLACSGLAPNSPKEQWLALAETAAAAGGMPPERDLFGVDDSLLSEPLRNSLDALYDLFAQAPELGSLIDPRSLQADLFQGGFDSVRALLAEALEQERTSDEQTERAVAAQGMAHAAELLAGRYHCVTTNVPYLARGRHGERLRAFCERHYPDARNDLATVFLERCLKLCAEDGTASLVLPQNWLFLTRYRNLRKKLLKAETWRLLARLGPGAFETISGEVVKAILLTLSRSHPTRRPDGAFDQATPAGTMYGLDVSEFRSAGEKARALREAEIKGVKQTRLLENPDARVALDPAKDLALLSKGAISMRGIVSGDSDLYYRQFWQLAQIISHWRPLQTSVPTTQDFGGREQVIDWSTGGSGMLRPGTENLAYGRAGIALGLMRNIPATIYSGELYNNNSGVIVPIKKSHLSAIWCFCSSSEYTEEVRRIDQKLNVTNATLVKVPFDLDHWTKVAKEKYPKGLPRPYSNDPTQWIFHGHPCGSVVWDEAEKRTADGPLRTDPTVLQAATARLLSYRWPAEQDAGMDLADEQRAWVRRCAGLRAWADEDGIVCIPSVRGEPPAGDRLLELLAAAFGNAWNDRVLDKLLAGAGSSSLDDWLRNRFFEQHCKLFHHRPFVWHVWDGRKRDGFHALVNYHKLAEDDGRGRRLLESLTYSYLGDWIARQRDGVRRGEGGAEDRLAAALELQKRLVAILDGEPPFDLFIRWKPIAEQPIGWEPDINDGVRLNIRPFLAGDIPGGKKGAGILRAKPNIHWRKDRGKEPQSFRDQKQFPWFWNGGNFTGERINHVHLTLAEKHAARDRSGG